MAVVIKYVDPTQLTDGGDGNTPETAKKFLTSVMSSINRNTDTKIIRLRGGYCQLMGVPNVWNGSVSGYDVTIEPYWLAGDEPTNPLLDGLTWLAEDSGGWTLEGAATSNGGSGFVWSIALGTSQTVRRVWMSAVNTGVKRSQRSHGEALRRPPNSTGGAALAGLPASVVTTDTIASIKDTLSVTDPWYGSGTSLTYKLYMWTPDSTMDPSKYYKGLAISQGGAGTFGFGFGFGLFNSRNFTVKNIDVRAAATTSYGLTVTDTDPLCQNIKFYRCNGTGTFSGFKVTQVSTAAYLVSIDGVEIRECRIDPLTSAMEQEPNEAYSLISGTDQYDIRGKLRKVSIIDSYGRNPGHAAMNMGSWDSYGAKPSQTGFLRHTVECDPWTTYSRSIGLSMCEPSCYILNCHFIGTNVVGQLAGSGLIMGNKFTGLRKCIRKISDAFNSFDGWVNIAIYRATGNSVNVGNDKWYDMKPDNLIFANNSCDGVYGTPIDMYYFRSDDTTSTTAKPQTALQDNAFLVYNNLYLEKVPERFGKPIVVMASQSGAPSLGVQPFYNNAFYAGLGQTPTVKINGTTYANINTAPGMKGNLTGDPMVDSELRPLTDSPLLKAGIFVGGKKDVSGKRFGIKPAIGAYEGEPPVVRKSRSTV